MFGFIKKLFGGTDDTPQPTRPQPASPTVAKPLVANTVGPAPGQAGFVAGAPVDTMLQREIVLDRELKVVGYDFRLRDSVLKRKEKMANSVWRLYDEVLMRNFLAEESTKAFGQKRIFLDVSVWALGSSLLSKLSKGRFVLMLRYDEEFFKNASAHIERLTALKEQGFQLGFDNFPLEPALLPLFPIADYHKISIVDKDVTELSKQISATGHAAPDAELLVGDIHFFEELQVARQLQVHLLQGSYMRRKELSEADAVDASYIRLLEVLNLVRTEAEPVVIASSIKYDPMLTFKLLRYVNSPGAGLVTKVETLDRALIVLGNKQLYRWLTLLLFSHERQEGDHNMLLETALIRGRIMETLGAKQFNRDDRDLLFTTGMFSMLDALLRQPMDKILQKLSLPAEVNQALLNHSGRFGPLLDLALCCEDGDLPDDPKLFAAAGVNRGEANRAQIEALLWVEEVV